MIKIAHARLNEVGQTMNGKPGDQTGNEVVVQALTNKDAKYWEYVLRPLNKTLAKGIVEDAMAIAQNDNIGYDQGYRYTMYEEAKKLNYDFKSISNKCSTDCSQMATTICIANGVKLSPYNWTVTMLENYMVTGKFEKLAYDPKMTFLPGDILLTVTQRHTAIVVSNDEADDTVGTVPKYVAEAYGNLLPIEVRTKPDARATQLKACPLLGVGNLVDVCDLVVEKGVTWAYIRVKGKYYGYIPNMWLLRKTPNKTAVATTDTWVRTNPGKEYNYIGFVKEGDKVEICDEKPTKEGALWYYILYKGYYGFTSKKNYKNVKSK